MAPQNKQRAEADHFERTDGKFEGFTTNKVDFKSISPKRPAKRPRETIKTGPFCGGTTYGGQFADIKDSIPYMEHLRAPQYPVYSLPFRGE